LGRGLIVVPFCEVEGETLKKQTKNDKL
jgi:hypothetical protein